MSPSRRRAVARGGSPPRCAAWQVAHAESFACRSSVRGTCAAGPRNRRDGDIEPYRHYTRSIPPPLPRSTLVSRRDSWLAPPCRIARGGSPPRCVAWHPALHARPVVRTTSRAPRNRFPPAPRALHAAPRASCLPLPSCEGRPLKPRSFSHYVSIHAPRRGATTARRLISRRRWFQITPPVFRRCVLHQPERPPFTILALPHRKKTSLSKPYV